jgi:hypothetical protein
VPFLEEIMRTSSVALASVVTALFTVSVFSQDGPKPSQLGSVTQQINQTTVKLDYSRPVARGRELFGHLVPWGKVWTPGANDATTISVSTDVRVNGQALAAGIYSVWSEPQRDLWTVVFNSAHPVFHLQYAAVAAQDALRVRVKSREGLHMETLAWYFPSVDGRKAELVAHWGAVVVPLQFDVP